MRENIIKDKSFKFAIRIVKLYKFLQEEKKEYVLSKQLLRCGTSIGANVSEAERGVSKKDFANKIGIALKEANECEYWIDLLHATDYLSEHEYKSIRENCSEINRLLISISRKVYSSIN